MKFSIFQDSRVGARPYNQDRIGHWYTRDSLLLVVADGMGGHLMGEVAAQIALDQLAVRFRKEAQTRIADPDRFLHDAVGRIHTEIDTYARKLDLPDSPRTTLVACIVQDGHAWWTHVGDSRLYLLRRSRIVERTRDHTRVQQLVDQGRIREEAISSHPERNRVLQCLGGGRAPQIEPTACARLAKDDIVLLCSDGFWGPLNQRQLVGTLAAKELKLAVPELMALAELRAGRGCDNLSVVAVRWNEEAVAPTRAAAPVTVPSFELPTDVQEPGATGADPGEVSMSDEEIERAIADIKAALKQYNNPEKR